MLGCRMLRPRMLGCRMLGCSVARLLGCRLLDEKHEAFEVVALGVEEVDRVIGALAEVEHDTDISAGFDACGYDSVVEELGGDYLTARESEEQASRFDGFDGEGIEPFVCLYSIVAFAHAFGKGGRINDDNIVNILVLTEVFEDIGSDALVVLTLVELGIVLGEGNGFGRNIHGYYRGGTVFGCIHRKASCVGKTIEY